MLVRISSKSALIGICLALLGGCTTPGFDSRLQNCRVVAYQNFPEKLINVQRERLERYEEFDGTMTCDDSLSVGGTTRLQCKQGKVTKTRRVPYLSVEDANADARNNFAWQCAKQACARDFGNSDCEPTARSAATTPSAKGSNLLPSPIQDQGQAKQLLGQLLPSWFNNPQIRNTQGFGRMCGENGWKVLGAWSDITGVTHYPTQIKIHVGSLWKAGIPCSVWEANIPVQINEADFLRLKSALKTLGADID